MNYMLTSGFKIMQKSNIFIKLFVLLVISVVTGFLLLVEVYSLPTDRIIANVERSESLYIENENKINNWVGGMRYGKLDNYTDAVMINASVCREYDSSIKNALLNPLFLVKEDINNETSTSDISAFMNQKNVSGYWEYSRYWHGYLLYMIPGLFIFDVGSLRVIMMGIQLLLFMYLCYKVSKIKPIYTIGYLATYVFISPITTILNFQNADILLISLIFSIIIFEYHDCLKQNNRYYLLFAFIGICTSYFDFLTYPIVTYGLPMISLLIVNQDNLKESAYYVVFGAFSWAFGYVGMWAGKWIVASLITGTNVLENAFGAALLRTGINDTSTENLSYIYALKNAYASFSDPPMTALFILSVLIIAVILVKNKKAPIINKKTISFALLVFLVGLSSYAWAFVARNHFVTHQFLEYRSLSTMVLAKYIAILSLF